MPMINLVRRFVRDDAGATAIEYGLIAALIAVAIIASATQVGSAIANQILGVAAKVIAAS
jgi:pilus assembly protein Flp/PilA